MSNSKNIVTILIVDDNPENLKIVSSILEKGGYKTRVAVNGSKALQSITVFVPELILLDIQMPEMDGYETCRHIKSDPELTDIPVIFMSAMTEIFDKVMAFEVGGVDYIQKPYQVDEILMRVHTHLQLSKVHKEQKLLNLDLYKKFKSTFEQAAVGIYHADLQNGRFLNINTRLSEMLGYSETEIHKLNRSDIIHPDFLEKENKFLNELLSGKISSYHHEFKAVCKSGERIWMRGTVSFIADKHENPDFLVGIMEDITKRKDTEKKLISSETRFRDISENMADWIWEVDANGVYTYTSRNVIEILGYEPNELIGKTPFDLMPEEEANRVGEIFRNLLKARKPISDLENWNITKSGNKVCMLTSGVRMFSEDGNFIGYRGVDINITERKISEERLKKSEELFRGLMESSGDAIVIVNDKHEIMQINEQCEKLFGYKQSEIAGKEIEILIPSDFHHIHLQHRKKYIQHPKNRIMGSGLELMALKKNGNSFPAEVSLSPLLTEEGLIVSTVVHDITERKKTDQELIESERRLRDAQHMAKIGNWELILDTNYLYWSEEIYSIFDIKTTEFEATFEAFVDFIHPEDREMVRTAYEKHIRNKAPYEVIHRILLKNNKVKYVRENCHSEFDKNGNAVKSIGTVQDITNEKLYEDEITGYRDHLEDIVKQRTIALEKEVNDRKNAEENMRLNMNELERFQKIAVGREQKMISLKEEVNQLREKLGMDQKYKIIE